MRNPNATIFSTLKLVILYGNSLKNSILIFKIIYQPSPLLHLPNSTSISICPNSSPKNNSRSIKSILKFLNKARHASKSKLLLPTTILIKKVMKSTISGTANISVLQMKRISRQLLQDVILNQMQVTLRLISSMKKMELIFVCSLREDAVPME